MEGDHTGLEQQAKELQRVMKLGTEKAFYGNYLQYPCSASCSSSLMH